VPAVADAVHEQLCTTLPSIAMVMISPSLDRVGQRCRVSIDWISPGRSVGSAGVARVTTYARISAGSELSWWLVPQSVGITAHGVTAEQ
jgi:hypothetical protein